MTPRTTALRISTLPLAAALVATLAQCGTLHAIANEPQWIALFDGESLAGWTPKIKGLPLGEDPLRTFRVEDGLLCVAYDGYASFDDRFGHLFYATPFSHYVLRATYRFVGEQVPGAPGWAYRNSGFMLHGQSAASMALDQSFPVSIEAQFLGASDTDEGERSTANLCTPGTNVVMGDALVTQHCLESTSRTFRGEQWVTVEFEVRGNGDIVHRVEGEEVMRYRHAQLDPNDADAQRVIAAGDSAMTLDGLQIGGGTISVQSESHAIQFKSIELLPLVP